MNPPRPLIFLALCLLLPSALAAQTVHSVPWGSPRISLHAQNRNLADLLKEFAAIQKLPIAISDQIKGTVSGTFDGVDAQLFLNAICESHGLIWFFDATRLHIEPADAVVSRVIPVTHLTQEKLQAALDFIGYASGPKGREVNIKSGHRSGLLVLTGGPQFLRATEALASDLDAQEATTFVERMEVRTFRLKYASAADTTVHTGQQTVILPGVATSLTNLMIDQQKSQSSPLSTGPMEISRSSARPTLRGTGLAATGSVGNPLIDAAREASAPQPAAASAHPSAPRGHADEAFTPNSPTVVVDTRLNAVLVRDLATRMPLYEELITQLDVPTHAVEITAAIIDIDANIGRDLGVELLGVKNKESNIYRFGFDADRGLFDGVDTQGQIPSFVEGANLARGAGFSSTALINGFGYEALTRLRALEQEGKAQVVTSPSVLTMENIQAVIRTDETVYVRVAGNMETDLYDVTTGVQFHVTPSIVDEGGGKTFRLQIEITDGSFTNQAVDAIPGTRESAITTQALVPESKTLLLGGYFVERKTKNYSGVPLLSKIPILKHALSRQDRSHARTQRYFFITPRLVNPLHEATRVRLDTPQIPGGTEIPNALTAKEIEDPQTDALIRKMATESIRLRMPPPPAPPVQPVVEQEPEPAKTPKPASSR